MESIDPKSSERTESKAKIKLFILEKNLLLIFVENCKYQRLDLRFIESIKASNSYQCAVNSQHRRQTNLNMQVASSALDNFL